MSSEVDKLLAMLKELDNDLSRIKSKFVDLQRSENLKRQYEDRKTNEAREKLTKLAYICEMYETELKKRDAYINQLEETIIEYKKRMRYW